MVDLAARDRIGERAHDLLLADDVGERAGAVAAIKRGAGGHGLASLDGRPPEPAGPPAHLQTVPLGLQQTVPPGFRKTVLPGREEK